MAKLSLFGMCFCVYGFAITLPGAPWWMSFAWIVLALTNGAMWVRAVGKELE